MDPNIRFGKPVIRGTRISVGDVLGHLAAGMSETEFLAEFPRVTHEDVLACLGFAADRERRLARIATAADHMSSLPLDGAGTEG